MENQIQPTIPPVQTPPAPSVASAKDVPPDKPKNWLLISLVIFVVLLYFGTAGFLAYRYLQLKNQVSQTKPTAVTSPSPTLANPTPSIELNIKLPETTIRNQTNNNYSSWSVFTDVRGYKFNYPPGWFLSEIKGEAAQIQNWDSNKVTRPGPLSGNQSKWDIDFTKNNFQDISNILKEKRAYMRVDIVEKSKTVNGLDIYFIEGTGPFFGNEDVRVPLIFAIIADNNQYFQWNSIYSGTENAEVLKQMVESITTTK